MVLLLLTARIRYPKPVVRAGSRRGGHHERASTTRGGTVLKHADTPSLPTVACFGTCGDASLSPFYASPPYAGRSTADRRSPKPPMEVRFLPGMPRDAVNLRPVRIHMQADGIPHPTCDGGVVPLRFYGHLLPSHVTAFVAQRTERPPPKREATGSIPVEGTRFHVIRRERSGMASGRFTGSRDAVMESSGTDIMTFFTGDADA